MKKSIRYTVLGFEPTPSEHDTLRITTRPGPMPNYSLDFHMQNSWLGWLPPDIFRLYFLFDFPTTVWPDIGIKRFQILLKYAQWIATAVLSSKGQRVTKYLGYLCKNIFGQELSGCALQQRCIVWIQYLAISRTKNKSVQHLPNLIQSVSII